MARPPRPGPRDARTTRRTSASSAGPAPGAPRAKGEARSSATAKSPRRDGDARPRRAAPTDVEARPRPGDPAWVQRRERRALSHVGGEIELDGGSVDERRALKRALDVSDDDDAVMRHVHGFHSYPARLHPSTAAALVRALSPERGVVLDPFSGSGTVSVEARLAGRRALASDVNPLAVELTRLKARAPSNAELQRWLAAGEKVVDHARTRQAARAGPSREYPREDRDLYDVHVLLELDGLSDGIARIEATPVRHALWLTLSSLLTKLSKKPGDTIEGRAPRRLPAGFAIEAFSRKLNELTERVAAFASQLPPGTPPLQVELADARRLDWVKPASVDLVLCSPPYPGVYDYYAHHAARLRWLGLPEHHFAHDELGARRRLARLDHGAALARWREELGAVVGAAKRVLAPQGRVAFVIADAALGRRAVRADELMRALAEDHGLELIASASQRRPHFHLPTLEVFARDPKREHVLLLAHARGALRPAASTPRLRSAAPSEVAAPSAQRAWRGRRTQR